MSAVPAICIIVTSLIAIIVLIRTMFYVRNLYSSHAKFLDNSKIGSFFDCDQHAQRAIPYQYNNFWVLPNFVLADEHNPKCNKGMTFIIQGQPADIFKLTELYSSKSYTEEYTSFAVHISNVEDVNFTVNAIKYVRECFYVVRDSSKEEEQLIKNKVSFHLYFRFQLLIRLDIPSNVYVLLDQEIDCSEASTIKDDIIAADTINQTDNVAILTGRNIAKLESATQLSLAIHESCFPSAQMFKQIFKELVQFLTHSPASSEKLIFLVPTVTTNLSYSAADKPIISHEGNTDNIIGINDTVGIFKLKQAYKYLETAHFNYITSYNAPLYDDREGLNIPQSERLWLLTLSMQDYNIMRLRSIFMVCYFSPKRNNFNDIPIKLNSTILSEYSTIYGSL